AWRRSRPGRPAWPVSRRPSPSQACRRFQPRSFASSVCFGLAVAYPICNSCRRNRQRLSGSNARSGNRIGPGCRPAAHTARAAAGQRRSVARDRRPPAADPGAARHDAPDEGTPGTRLARAVATLTPGQAELTLCWLEERFAGAPAPVQRHRRIALIGLRGAGKTSLGRMLAERVHVPFFELDQEIEREAAVDLSELFDLHGQAGYRRLERQVLERLVHEGDAAVIATGGSIVAEPVTYELLLRHCLTVWVRASPEEHMQRVLGQSELRPMHDNTQALEELRAILASREALYRRADLQLDTGGRSLPESLHDLLQLLGRPA